MRWRQAPSMTPVAIGQPCVEGLVVAQELALVSQVADARVGAGAPAAFQAGGVGLGGDLGGGPVAVAGQDREGLDRDPVLGGGVPGVVEAPGGAPDVLKNVDYVDHDVDRDAAAGGLGADQAELVLGAVDEDDPGPQVAAGRGPRPRRTRRRSCRRGPCGRTRPATWPGPSARAGAARAPCRPPGGAITSCGRRVRGLGVVDGDQGGHPLAVRFLPGRQPGAHLPQLRGGLRGGGPQRPGPHHDALAVGRQDQQRRRRARLRDPGGVERGDVGGGIARRTPRPAACRSPSRSGG